MEAGSQKLIGMRSLEINPSDVGAVLFGFTSEFSFYDMLLANMFLADDQCQFIQEAPDSTFRCLTDSGQEIFAPCRNYIPTE